MLFMYVYFLELCMTHRMICFKVVTVCGVVEKAINDALLFPSDDRHVGIEDGVNSGCTAQPSSSSDGSDAGSSSSSSSSSSSRVAGDRLLSRRDELPTDAEEKRGASAIKLNVAGRTDAGVSAVAQVGHT
jgi:hypothetical protein